MTPLSQVLVVDDDELTRHFLTRALRPHYRVFTAASVREAEPILAAEEFKVIVCDDQMPGETGLMYLSRIRDLYPWMRRLLLTGNDQRSALVFAINEVHVFHYLIKPVTVEELLRLVHEGVAGYDQARAATQAAEEGERLRRTVAKHLHTTHLSEPAATHERRVWLRLMGWGSTAAAALLALGVGVLATLYFLKTWLGINFFENRHLTDFW